MSAPHAMYPWREAPLGAAHVALRRGAAGGERRHGLGRSGQDSCRVALPAASSTRALPGARAARRRSSRRDAGTGSTLHVDAGAGAPGAGTHVFGRFAALLRAGVLLVSFPAGGISRRPAICDGRAAGPYRRGLELGGAASGVRLALL